MGQSKDRIKSKVSSSVRKASNSFGDVIHGSPSNVFAKELRKMASAQEVIKKEEQELAKLKESLENINAVKKKLNAPTATAIDQEDERENLAKAIADAASNIDYKGEIVGQDVLNALNKKIKASTKELSSKKNQQNKDIIYAKNLFARRGLGEPQESIPKETLKNAAIIGDPKLFQQAFSKNPSQLNIKGADGKTPLGYAIENGLLDLSEAKQGELKKDYDAKEQAYNTKVRENPKGTITSLLKEVDGNTIGDRKALKAAKKAFEAEESALKQRKELFESFKNNPHHQAYIANKAAYEADKTNKDKLDKAIELFNPADKSGKTPLDYAIASGNKDVAALFDHTELHLKAGKVKGFEDVKIDASEIDTQDINGSTPLHIAVKSGNTAMVNDIVVEASDLSLQDKDGNTVLHLAAINGDIDLYNSLTSKNVNLTIKNNAGHDFLEAAFANKDNDPKFVEAFVKDYVSDFVENEKLTHRANELVTIAAEAGNTKILEALQNQGIPIPQEKLDLAVNKRGGLGGATKAANTASMGADSSQIPNPPMGQNSQHPTQQQSPPMRQSPLHSTQQHNPQVQMGQNFQQPIQHQNPPHQLSPLEQNSQQRSHSTAQNSQDIGKIWEEEQQKNGDITIGEITQGYFKQTCNDDGKFHYEMQGNIKDNRIYTLTIPSAEMGGSNDEIKFQNGEIISATLGAKTSQLSNEMIAKVEEFQERDQLKNPQVHQPYGASLANEKSKKRGNQKTSPKKPRQVKRVQFLASRLNNPEGQSPVQLSGKNVHSLRTANSSDNKKTSPVVTPSENLSRMGPLNSVATGKGGQNSSKPFENRDSLNSTNIVGQASSSQKEQPQRSRASSSPTPTAEVEKTSSVVPPYSGTSRMGPLNSVATEKGGQNSSKSQTRKPSNVDGKKSKERFSIAGTRGMKRDTSQVLPRGNPSRMNTLNSAVAGKENAEPNSLKPTPIQLSVKRRSNGGTSTFSQSNRSLFFEDDTVREEENIKNKSALKNTSKEMRKSLVDAADKSPQQTVAPNNSVQRGKGKVARR